MTATPHQVLTSTIVQLVEFKLKLKCTKGALGKFLVEGQSSQASKSLLNITANIGRGTYLEFYHHLHHL